jgi:hypothetical protein
MALLAQEVTLSQYPELEQDVDLPGLAQDATLAQYPEVEQNLGFPSDAVS